MPTERYKETYDDCAECETKTDSYILRFNSLVSNQFIRDDIQFVVETDEEMEEMRQGINFIIDQIVETGSANTCIVFREASSRKKCTVALSNIVSLYTNFDVITKTKADYEE